MGSVDGAEWPFVVSPTAPDDSISSTGTTARSRPVHGRKESITAVDPRRFTPTLHASLVAEILSLRRDIDGRDGAIAELEQALGISKAETEELESRLGHQNREFREVRRQLEQIEQSTVAALEELVTERDGLKNGMADLRLRAAAADARTAAKEAELRRIHDSIRTDRAGWDADRRVLDRRLHAAENRARDSEARLAAVVEMVGRDQADRDDVFGPDGTSGLRSPTPSPPKRIGRGHVRTVSAASQTSTRPVSRFSTFSTLSSRLVNGPAGLSLADELAMGEEAELGLLEEEDEDGGDGDGDGETELNENSQTVDEPAESQSTSPGDWDSGGGRSDMPDEQDSRTTSRPASKVLREVFRLEARTRFPDPQSPQRYSLPPVGGRPDRHEPVRLAAVSVIADSRPQLAAISLKTHRRIVSKADVSVQTESSTPTVLLSLQSALRSVVATQTDSIARSTPLTRLDAGVQTTAKQPIWPTQDLASVLSTPPPSHRTLPIEIPSITVHPPPSTPQSPFSVLPAIRFKIETGTQTGPDWCRRSSRTVSIGIQTDPIRIDRRIIAKLPAHLQKAAMSLRSSAVEGPDAVAASTRSAFPEPVKTQIPKPGSAMPFPPMSSSTLAPVPEAAVVRARHTHSQEEPEQTGDTTGDRIDRPVDRFERLFENSSRKTTLTRQPSIRRSALIHSGTSAHQGAAGPSRSSVPPPFPVPNRISSRRPFSSVKSESVAGSSSGQSGRTKELRKSRSAEPADPERVSAAPPPSPQSSHSVVDAIAATMVGEWMWKYVRRKKAFAIGDADSPAESAARHRRWVWLSPYDRSVMWSSRQPISGSALLGKGGRKLAIQSVLDVRDNVPLPKSASATAVGRSIVVLTPARALKFTAESLDRHIIWLTALSFLAHSASAVPGMAPAAPLSVSTQPLVGPGEFAAIPYDATTPATPPASSPADGHGLSDAADAPVIRRVQPPSRHSRKRSMTGPHRLTVNTDRSWPESGRMSSPGISSASALASATALVSVSSSGPVVGGSASAAYPTGTWHGPRRPPGSLRSAPSGILSVRSGFSSGSRLGWLPPVSSAGQDESAEPPPPIALLQQTRAQRRQVVPKPSFATLAASTGSGLSSASEAVGTVRMQAFISDQSTDEDGVVDRRSIISSDAAEIVDESDFESEEDDEEEALDDDDEDDAVPPPVGLGLFRPRQTTSRRKSFFNLLAEKLSPSPGPPAAPVPTLSQLQSPVYVEDVRLESADGGSSDRHCQPHLQEESFELPVLPKIAFAVDISAPETVSPTGTSLPMFFRAPVQPPGLAIGPDASRPRGDKEPMSAPVGPVRLVTTSDLRAREGSRSGGPDGLSGGVAVGPTISKEPTSAPAIGSVPWIVAALRPGRTTTPTKTGEGDGADLFRGF